MGVIGGETPFLSNGSSMNETVEPVERAQMGLPPSATARSEAMPVRRGQQLRSTFSDQRPGGDNEKRIQKISDTVGGKRISLLGIPIDALTEKEVVDRIIFNWRRGRGGWVVTPNLDHLRILCRRPDLKHTIAEAATLLLADGMPLVWASRLQGTPLPARVAGSELILSLTAAAAQAGASIFFLGGSPGAGDRTAALLATAYPGLKIAGVLAPPMGFELDPQKVAAIRDQIVAANPAVVYSCFGFPKQEWVIQQLREHLPGSWFLGLGGSLSMISGEFWRAPRWMRSTGLEWLCRLAQEPHRLFKRYIIQDAPFVWRLFASALWHRWFPSRPGAGGPPGAIPLRIPSRTIGVVSSNGRTHATDEETRERILSRYSSSAIVRRWHRARARLEQFAWTEFLGWGRAIKRTIDIVGALFLLILSLPLLVGFAVLVKVTSPGPVFFTQTRVGKRGRLFRMYKFRSMHVNAEERMAELLTSNEVAGGVIFKIKNDPRRTPIGSFMRTWSIDELPQLWNVLFGDMSLVGPRPPLPSEVQQYTLAQRQRLEALPGLTCTWQVSGRCDIPFEKQVELDVEYIESQSISLDVKLLFQTVSAVFQRRGAY
jgi:exopolysaccharide biosynthesis WecB/TagA/CpsF family protein